LIVEGLCGTVSSAQADMFQSYLFSTNCFICVFLPIYSQKSPYNKESEKCRKDSVAGWQQYADKNCHPSMIFMRTSVCFFVKKKVNIDQNEKKEAK
jgi:hypothetical protein